MLLHGFSVFDLSTRMILFVFIYTVVYRTEPVKGNVVCTFNPCSFNLGKCINGGTCKSSADCSAVCECPPDFDGDRCERRKGNESCEVKCSPETCNGNGYCKQDPDTCDLGCDCFNGFGSDACNASVAINETHVDPCYPLTCVHGVCNSSKLEKKCICDDQWLGDTCNIPCRKNCTLGRCHIFLGEEKCGCPGDFSLESNCTKKTQRSDSDSDSELPQSLLVFVLVFPILLLLIFTVLVYVMWKKRMIFVMKIVYFLQKYEDSDGKLYDAFISYRSSECDELWVLNKLFPMLENEMGFKVCIHYRDFHAGETISNNIIDAIENSRRTILVISPDYVNGEWTRMEYQVAQQEMLSLRHKIIPIMFRDIDDEKGVDKNLKLILNSITYIQWPTSEKEKDMNKFWQQLRLTMPKKHEGKSTLQEGGDVINERTADTTL